MRKSIKLLLSTLALAAMTAAAPATAHQSGKSGGTMPGHGTMGMGHGHGGGAHPSASQGSHHGAMQGGHHGGGQRGMGGHYKGRGHHMGGAMMHRRLRVTPVQHLGIDDVSHYFGHYLERLGNERLKLGKVTKKDDDTITAEIVTLEGSLVQTFEVDRHSGAVR